MKVIFWLSRILVSGTGTNRTQYMPSAMVIDRPRMIDGKAGERSQLLNVRGIVWKAGRDVPTNQGS